jgi:hypothetical protein
MKGSLHTDELMAAVTSGKTGLRTARRISHVFVMDVPTYPETLFITDAAINIFPDLDAKHDIIQNAIDLFTQVDLGNPARRNFIRGRDGDHENPLDDRGGGGGVIAVIRRRGTWACRALPTRHGFDRMRFWASVPAAQIANSIPALPGRRLVSLTVSQGGYVLPQ